MIRPNHKDYVGDGSSQDYQSALSAYPNIVTAWRYTINKIAAQCAVIFGVILKILKGF